MKRDKAIQAIRDEYLENLKTSPNWLKTSPARKTVRYSPAKITGCEKIPQLGDPDYWRICTSHVERLNLTIRINLWRLTHLTNGHSKSLKHHLAMQPNLFAWYNFVRVPRRFGKRQRWPAD